MTEFKNSFYQIAVDVAKKNPKSAGAQLVMIDNFTSHAPILAGMPFQKASHDRHHAYSRLLDATSMKVVDLDGVLPTMHVDSQLETVNLTPIGGKYQFGEDRMIHTHNTPESFLATLVPSVMRKSGMEFEASLYRDNFLVKTLEYGTARSVSTTASAGNQYPSMVAVTWEPGEMTGLYSPLPYGSGESFGRLFETKWLNNKAPHTLPNGVTGYVAECKVLIGILLANQKKIASLVNIDKTPTALQLAALVNAATSNSSTRIYCSAALKTSIAAAYARTHDGNGLVAVSSAGEVTVLGVPIVTSNNIPKTVDFIPDIEVIKE